MYYSDKLETLRDIFGANEVRVETSWLVVDQCADPIIDDVIILLD